MRIQSSIRNISFGMAGQMISVILGLIVRTVFIYTLGIEYVGVEGLFTSVLLMLSLVNLGFDTAMIYSLYRPLAENDVYKIQALMNLYKNAYKIIGIVVLIIGLSLLPIIPYLINGETNISNLKIIYILFLLQSVASYFFSYKQSILVADQKSYIISKIHAIFVIFSNFIQIILLLSIGIYIVVLSIQVIFKIVENIFIAQKADKLYPYLKENNQAFLGYKEKKLFYENLFSLFLYKISGAIINGTDNIVISLFIGITLVGVYSNYLLIISTLSTLLGYIFYSLTASIGNLNVTEEKKKNYLIFRVIHFTNFWIYGLSSIFLWNLINPFMSLWLGEQYLLSMAIVFTIILNFYTAGMQNASTTYRETTGMFKKGKYRPLIAAMINIGVSLILVKLIGIAGVIMGTVISRLFTYFWYDPYVIFKYVFNKSAKFYFIRYIFFTLIVLIGAMGVELIKNLINISPNSMVLSLVIDMVLCFIIPNVFFYIVFRKSAEFLYLWSIAKQLKGRMRSKRVLKKEKVLL